MPYQDHFETDALPLRRFTEDDWPALLAYGEYRNSIEYDRWEKWPSDEKGSKDTARYFAAADNCWAVSRKSDGQVLGFITFNEVTDGGHLDMGHGFLPARIGNQENAEAIRRMVDYAFSLPGIVAVEARNPEEWAEQVAPLISLGFEPFEHGRIIRKKP